MNESRERPNGWEIVKIGDVFNFIGGGTPSKKQESYWNGNISWASVKDVKGDYLKKTVDTITKEGLENSAANLAYPKDVILITRILPGRTIISRITSAINQDLKVVKPRFKTNPEFVRYLFSFIERECIKLASGTTVLGISLNNLNEIFVPLPPLPEQHRIVAKIEELFSSLDKGIESLKAAQQQLKVYRQAVLKWAFEGRLTEEWRKQQKDLPTALQLLEQIKTEREKQAKANGKKLKPVAPITETKLAELPTLPEGWCWVTPDILSAIDSNSICAGPFGTIFKAKDFRESGIPIIFLRHVKAGQYKTEKPGFMDGNKWKELFTSYSVFGGELLITKLGDPPGECAIYPTGIGPAMVTPDIIKMSANETIVILKFLMHYFNSEVSKRLSQDAAFGTTRLRVTIPIFRGSPTVFCSIEEQNQIVQEIETRLSVADKVEETIEQSLKQSEALRLSILKKAFEGKLVPQDRNDEPASVLLARIKAEREKDKPRSRHAGRQEKQKRKRQNHE